MVQELERHLMKAAESNREEFPVQGTDYWKRYDALLQNLRRHVYPNVNAGLACLSKSPGFYTDHGESHFDEVVKYAGLLIRKTLEGPKPALNGYEIYLLLCAIRLHDAGNITGREDHNNKVIALIMQYGGDITRDSAEAQLISEIAAAHGGRTFDNSKDTIGALQEDAVINATAVRPRLLAALVRFADEICEHSSRAASHLIETGALPEQSKLFHYYAKSICGAFPDRDNKSFRLRLNFDISWLVDKFPTPPNEDGETQQKYLFDDALDRICKLNHERVYCNRFLLPQMQTDQIFVEISFTKFVKVAAAPVPIPQSCDAIKFVIQDKGYPNVPDTWRTETPDLNGAHFAALSQNGWKQ